MRSFTVLAWSSMLLALLLIVAVFVLGACTPQQVATAQAKLAVACQVDGALQPVGATALAAAGGTAAAAAALDSGVVHPAIQAACASLGGKPVITTLPPPTGAPTAAH